MQVAVFRKEGQAENDVCFDVTKRRMPLIMGQVIENETCAEEHGEVENGTP